jgi:SAM-dependent methyltransferase
MVPIKPMALAGVHDAALAALRQAVPTAEHAKVLDVGAGRGALSQRICGLGYDVTACDLAPESFAVEGVSCLRVDAGGELPFPDAHFDAVLAVEVVEHLEAHARFFQQITRVLRPGGAFVFTTPNILSLKSRLKFFLTGYFYSFGPLEPGVKDPTSQHLSPFTLDRYRFVLAEAGLLLERIATDKLQGTSRVLAFLAPIIRFYARLSHGRAFAGAGEIVARQNSREALYGRTLVLTARK